MFCLDSLSRCIVGNYQYFMGHVFNSVALLLQMFCSNAWVLIGSCIGHSWSSQKHWPCSSMKLKNLDQNAITETRCLKHWIPTSAKVLSTAQNTRQVIQLVAHTHSVEIESWIKIHRSLMFVRCLSDLSVCQVVVPTPSWHITLGPYSQ